MSIDSVKVDADVLAGAKKKQRERPSMQIYRPPGLRSSNTPTTPTQPKSNGTATPPKEPQTFTEPPPPVMKPSKPSSSSLKSDSQPKQSSSSGSKSSRSENTPSRQPPVPSLTRTLSNVIKEPRKKPIIQKELDEIVQTFRKLSLSKDRVSIDDFIASNLENETIARSLGSYLVQYAIEEDKAMGRTVARLCASLLECPSGVAFHQGLVTSILQYYDCRDQLRVDHLRVWVGFLSFVSDLYSHVGFTYEGEMVEVIFNIFDYLLKPPILESLKIEELECMISSLLSVGYDLERQCPDELGRLKNQIRDAFIDVSEPWARKMVLLLLELCASGWNLPASSNDYYFG
uniref:MIF4G domain-containing protein n=1 Tax=Panagrellus redivivus TaxID=6233 RepID=A0A7E4VDC5_PANRE